MINGEQQYIKRVAAKLHCSSEKKKVILSCVQDTIAEHELRDADYTAIAAALGEPENMAQEYADVAVACSTRTKALLALLALQAAVVIALCGWLAGAAIDRCMEQKSFRTGYYVETMYVVDTVSAESDSNAITTTVEANDQND